MGPWSKCPKPAANRGLAGEERRGEEEREETGEKEGEEREERRDVSLRRRNRIRVRGSYQGF